ncbi:MAG: 4Fe-4S binding protein, partial [Candidatus Omnitrophota bacterium]
MGEESRIKVVLEKCTGCTLCVRVCPFGAIKVENKKAVIDLSKCNLCGACPDTCKFSAILLEKKAAVKKDLSGYKDVWVFCEQKKGVVQTISYELLGEGKKLAKKLGGKLCAVLLGDKIEGKADELAWRGADKIYLVDAPQLKNYQDDPYTKVLVELIREYKPEALLCGATTIGRSLISRVAI